MTQTQTPPAAVGPASISTVEQHLQADKTLKMHLGPRDTPIPRRNNDGVINFPKFAVDLTRYIVAKGEQPLQLKGSQVADHARRFIDEQAEQAREQSAVDATPEAAPLTPEADASASPEAAAPSPVAPVTPAATAEPAKKRTRAAKAPAVVSTNTAPAAPAAPAAAPSAATATLSGDADPERRVSVGFAVYCLLHGADVLAERDTLPGAEKRRAQLLSTLAAYRPFSTP